MLDFAWRKNWTGRAYIYKKKKKKIYIHTLSRKSVCKRWRWLAPPTRCHPHRPTPCNLRAQNPLISLPISSPTLTPRNVVFSQRKQALTTKSCPEKYPCNIWQHFKNADFTLKILRLQKSSCPKLKKCCINPNYHLRARTSVQQTQEKRLAKREKRRIVRTIAATREVTSQPQQTKQTIDAHNNRRYNAPHR